MARVLIVDDARFMRTLIRRALEEAGFEVVGEAESGGEAVEKYKELKPDVVTLDIVMPDKGGIDVLKEILQVDPNAKVVLVSAMGQSDMIGEALKIGAKDYIVKPFSPQMLVEIITRVVTHE